MLLSNGERMTLWNWRIFWTLEVAGVLAVVALIPYTLTLQGPMLKQYPLPIPLAVLVPVSYLACSDFGS